MDLVPEIPLEKDMESKIPIPPMDRQTPMKTLPSSNFVIKAEKLDCAHEYLGLICVKEGIVYRDVRVVHLAVLVDVAQAAQRPHEHQMANHVSYQVARPLGFT